MTLTASPETKAQLSVLMRDGSRSEHEAAEGSSFMEELLAGKLSPEGYLVYLRRLRDIYEAMEDIAQTLTDDPIAGVLIDSKLDRLGSIDADIEYWAERTEGSEVIDPKSAAVDAYVARLRESGSWGGLFVAHHYTRYLGDLSGGQAIGKILSRAYELDGRGVAFYDFPEIEKLKPYKDGYRTNLDSLEMSEDDKLRLLEEVKVAFNLNQALFEELTKELLPTS
jgi:heme oxygenase